MVGFLAYPITALAKSNHFNYLAIAAFTAGYLYVIWRNTPVRHTNRTPGAIAATLACGALLLPTLQFPWLGGLTYFASIMFLINCEPRRSCTVVAGLLLVFCAATEVFPATLQSKALMLMPLAITSGIQVAVYKRLDTALGKARVELARLAVGEERLRIARDMHDILGHNLTAIALRAELAAYLVVPQPHHAMHEINEVADIARTTVAEVKAVVSGYRQMSLSGEIWAAMALLTAAGLSANIDVTVEAVEQLADERAVWVVKEAVTNVIRHSKARRCWITIAREDGALRVEVQDDGVGASLPGTPPFGNGLGGLTERVSMAGGEVSVEPRDGWFVVRARLPVGLAAVDRRP